MDTVQDEDELVFLYQLVRGKTDTSYACHVAASMGLDPAIVKRGVQVCCVTNIHVIIKLIITCTSIDW